MPPPIPQVAGAPGRREPGSVGTGVGGWAVRAAPAELQPEQGRQSWRRDKVRWASGRQWAVPTSMESLYPFGMGATD